MPPRLKPRIAPNRAAVTIIPGVERGVVRENRADVYASERVQKASRKYNVGPPGKIISHTRAARPDDECKRLITISIS